VGIFDRFSQRQKKREKAGQPDVYQYEDLPRPFRVQIIQILTDALGEYEPPHPYSTRRLPVSNQYWEEIHKVIAHEKGVFSLGQRATDPPSLQCKEYLMATTTDDALDIIELSFRVVDRVARNLHAIERRESNITVDADTAIADLNHRFREHGIGYQFEAGELIRIDSQYVHDQAVRPAITLLQEARFQGVSDEFLRAHEHYRKGNYKEAVAEALKAFESTMKAICDARKWTYGKKDTASKLISVIFDKGLITPELQSHFAAVRSTLESGLPTVRNTSTASHGQGSMPISIPEHLVAYALHLAAANIVLLVKAHKSSSKDP